MNRIILMGRLTRDPELRQTQSGTPVCSFTLAVDRRVGKDQERRADFIDCTAWQKAAEFVSKYFFKGQLMALEGRLQMRDWTDKNGNKRRSAEVVADNIEFCGGRNEGRGSEAQVPVDVEFDESDDEEDLPF